MEKGANFSEDRRRRKRMRTKMIRQLKRCVRRAKMQGYDGLTIRIFKWFGDVKPVDGEL